MKDLTTTSRLVSAVLCLTMAGCGSQSGPSGGDANAGDTSRTVAADAGHASAIDACSLIAAEDISALLGVTVEGRSTSNNPEVPACVWENPENYESISLEIGNPGTAINGTLPPPEPGMPDVGRPGPDGMRFLGYGQVEFPAAGRNNSVQVAVLSMSADQADNAAVELARKVGPQLPE
ncbi:DUF3558 domain-containing protein [Mycobacterium sp. 4D054]|uniref:DUF3558 domain-containing protein n=1 Tax=unclassified Mycobacterium TaxID=2642494 RepID=UPI0021B255F6|nr:DUF3558 domain-containing protein [Mycobacterium sp. SMC-8]UXA10239.1 DUF3558 domain-containing protein [Mycobacterium sp. SMC-8]